MALIKSIEEIKAVIPRISGLSNTANLPNVGKAGRMHIIPIIGKQLYNDLDTKLAGNTIAGKDQELLKHIQLPLAAFALLDDMAFLQTVITDNGIRTNNSPNMSAAHRWEYKELENALRNYAADGLEILLDFLFENKMDFNLWTTSPEYKEISSFLISSGIDFSKYYTLSQPFRTFWQLKPTMMMVEEKYLASMFGRKVLEWVKSKDEILIVSAGSEIDVKKIIKRAAAQFTIKHAAETLAVDFGAAGFTVLAFRGSLDDAISDGKVAASNADISRKIEAANREGQNDLATAAKYLQGIGEGTYGAPLQAEILDAYSYSPLKPDPSAGPITSGNERRKIFVF